MEARVWRQRVGQYTLHPTWAPRSQAVSAGFLCTEEDRVPEKECSGELPVIAVTWMRVPTGGPRWPIVAGHTLRSLRRSLVFGCLRDFGLGRV